MMGSWDTQEPLRGIGLSPQSALAKPTLLQGPYGKILSISVCLFLDCFPNFKLLSLFVEVKGSS